MEKAVAFGIPGTLMGTVTDSSTGEPIDGAQVDLNATSAEQWSWNASTDSEGAYYFLIAGTEYTANVTAFGYNPVTKPNITVSSGLTAVADFSPYTNGNPCGIGGRFSIASTGWPVYARIDVAADGFSGSIFSYPGDGAYTLKLVHGLPYTLTVEALVQGYAAATRTIIPIADTTHEDFLLEPDTYCHAQGYGRNSFFYDSFENGLGNWTATGLWNVENVNDPCAQTVSPFPGHEHALYFRRRRCLQL